MDNHNALEQAWLNGYRQGRQAVEKCGPIDVAVVVRCKDCVHYVDAPCYALTCDDAPDTKICRHTGLDYDTECGDHWI